MGGNFLDGRPYSSIPARCESDSDESITFPNHVIAEGFFWAHCCWPHRVAAGPYIDTPLRCKEEIIKAYISDLKYMSMDELERGLKERELNRLLD